MTNIVLKHFGSYNQRRYSAPWVCLMNEKGEHDFNANVGTYTGNRYNGDGGDIVIFEPVEGAVYGCGQKDYRNPKYTEKNYYKWTGETFVEVDKLGREIVNQ